MEFDFASFSWFRAIIAFCAMFLMDCSYALWVRRTSTGDALASGFYAAFVMCLNSVVVLSYVDNKLYLPFVVLGAFSGSYFIVKFDHGRLGKTNENKSSSL